MSKQRFEHFDKSSKTFVHHYPTLDSLINVPIEYPDLHAENVTSRTSDTTWFGVRNAAEVGKVLHSGWHDGTTKAIAELDKVNLPPMPSIRRKRRRGSFGDNLDPHAVLAGKLDRAWDRRVREMRVGKGRSHITLFADIAANCRVTADEAFWRGAVAAMIVDALQRSGRSVRLIAGWKVSNFNMKSNRNLLTTAVVKEFGTPMTVDVVMGMLALIGFFRTYGFADIASIKGEEPGYGYGRPVSISREELESQTFGGFGDSEEIIMIPRSVWSREQAIEATKMVVSQFTQ